MILNLETNRSRVHAISVPWRSHVRVWLPRRNPLISHQCMRRMPRRRFRDSRSSRKHHVDDDEQVPSTPVPRVSMFELCYYIAAHEMLYVLVPNSFPNTNLSQIIISLFLSSWLLERLLLKCRIYCIKNVLFSLFSRFMQIDIRYTCTVSL